VQLILKVGIDPGAQKHADIGGKEVVLEAWFDDIPGLGRTPWDF